VAQKNQENATLRQEKVQLENQLRIVAAQKQV